MTDDWDNRDTTNNNSKSGPVIITAECRIKNGMNGKMTPYNCLNGQHVNMPFRVTIHNYESEALGYDPTIKSEQNYFRFLHLSTLLNFPWAYSIKFRDDDGVVFEVGDIIRLLEERTEEAMIKWEVYQKELEEKQGKVLKKVEAEYGVVVTTKFKKPPKSYKPKSGDGAMLI